MNEVVPSLSDIAAVTGNRNNGFGDGNESYGRMRNSRGQYMDSYGRRGVDSKYRDGSAYGHMEDMQDSYSRYQESMGRYGASQESMDYLEDTLESTYKMLKGISEKSENPEEMELIKEYAQKMSRL